MFKNAATKIAHNSTLPSLNIAGNKDLKPLQDLIIAEKTVLISLQKLSLDLNKASEALRTWGMGEGEDLGDTLNASTSVLTYFSDSLSTYATHEHVIRDHMKSIRTREEGLDELKRRRKSVGAKADAAEKKLNKMTSEHKNLPMQTELLNRLRDEMRSLDGEIMTEEASLGDFKRQATRDWMSLKFGGLAETCDKGSIIAQVGKHIISMIPADHTQPGLPRSPYSGHARIESLLTEAQERIRSVHLDTTQQGSESEFERSGYHLPPPQDYTHNRGSFMEENEQSLLNRFEPEHTAQAGYDGMPRSVDDFGVPTRHAPTGSQDYNTGGGKFATFPVKSNPSSGSNFMDRGPSYNEPLALGSHDQEDRQSFASSVVAALNFAEHPYSPPSQTISHSPDNPKMALQHEAPAHSDSAPPYEYDSPSTHQYKPGVAGLPPGAAAPNPWDSVSLDDRRMSTGEDEGGLAYAGVEENPADETKNSRHVRFGGADEEFEATTPDAWNNGGGRKKTTSMSRVAPPKFDPTEDERELNAAAAREVSRELDTLTFNPPAHPATTRDQYEPDPQGFEENGHHQDASTPVPYDNLPLRPDSSSYSQPPHRRAPSPAMTPIDTSFTSTSGTPSQGTSQPITMSSPISGSSPLPSPGAAPFRTPEYARAPSNRSTSSLISPPTGARTISAAAFRRPQRQSNDAALSPSLGETPPLALRKHLPSSPRPLGSRDLSEAPSVYTTPQQNQEGESFDYIGAYGDGDRQAPPGGYGDGKFTTNLENSR